MNARARVFACLSVSGVYLRRGHPRATRLSWELGDGREYPPDARGQETVPRHLPQPAAAVSSPRGRDVRLQKEEVRARTLRPAAESRARVSADERPGAGRASAIRPESSGCEQKSDRATTPPPPSRHVTLTTRTPSRPLQYLRDAIAAVEIDFGGGLFERIEVTLDDDPVAVAREFCQAKGFSLTISIPLAVKLAQARDKARRRARARVSAAQPPPSPP